MNQNRQSGEPILSFALSIWQFIFIYEKKNKHENCMTVEMNLKTAEFLLLKGCHLLRDYIDDQIGQRIQLIIENMTGLYVLGPFRVRKGVHSTFL